MSGQGVMGKLESKTKAELIDLLARQHKLLANPKRLESLPDKGHKIQLLAEKLQRFIADYVTPVDDTADLFEQLDIGTINFKDKVIPQAIKNAFLKTDPPKSNFKPYRSLKTDKIPEGFVRPPAPPSRGGTPLRGVEGRPREVSAVSIAPLRHPGTKALNVMEAGDLLQKQKSKVQALLAEQAAERLAERFDIKMGQYIPLTPGRYRDQDTERDESDESSEEEDDGSDEDNDIEDDDKGSNGSRKPNPPNR